MDTGTLLSIGQSVARKCRIPVPATIYGNTDLDVARIYEAIIEACDEIYDEKVWQYLIKHDASIILVADSDTYDLPVDFGRFMPNTLWDRTNNKRVHGPVSDEKWHRLYGRAVSVSTDRYVKVVRTDTGSVRKRLQFYPEIETDDDGDEIYYSYVSRYYIAVTGVSSFQETFSADSNIILFDDDLVKLCATWKFRQDSGLSYQAAEIAYRRKLARISSYDESYGRESFDVRGRMRPFKFPNIPDTGAG